ncbi:MAG: putative toxin-antitoxin system toxin component, PIN family [Terriglobia bacterium]
MRTVLDTNVLISALLLRDSVTRRAFDAAFAKGKVLVSFELLAELNSVLSRKRFRKYVDETDVRRFAAALLREAEWVNVVTSITTCRDQADDKILALALDGKATCIVTGDNDLLALDPFRGIRIQRPDQFLRHLPSIA